MQIWPFWSARDGHRLRPQLEYKGDSPKIIASAPKDQMSRVGDRRRGGRWSLANRRVESKKQGSHRGKRDRKREGDSFCRDCTGRLGGIESKRTERDYFGQNEKERNELQKKKVADPFDKTGHERAIVRGLGCSIYCGKAIGSPAVHVTHAVRIVRTVRRRMYTRYGQYV